MIILDLRPDQAIFPAGRIRVGELVCQRYGDIRQAVFAQVGSQRLGSVYRNLARIAARHRLDTQLQRIASGLNDLVTPDARRDFNLLGHSHGQQMH